MDARQYIKQEINNIYEAREDIIQAIKHELLNTIDNNYLLELASVHRALTKDVLKLEKALKAIEEA